MSVRHVWVCIGSAVINQKGYEGYQAILAQSNLHLRQSLCSPPFLPRLHHILWSSVCIHHIRHLSSSTFPGKRTGIGLWRAISGSDCTDQQQEWMTTWMNYRETHPFSTAAVYIHRSADSSTYCRQTASLSDGADNKENLLFENPELRDTETAGARGAAWEWRWILREKAVCPRVHLYVLNICPETHFVDESRLSGCNSSVQSRWHLHW